MNAYQLLNTKLSSKGSGGLKFNPEFGEYPQSNGLVPLTHKEQSVSVSGTLHNKIMSGKFDEHQREKKWRALIALSSFHQP